MVDRVRAARQALAKDYDCDAEKLGRMLIERQDRSKHKYVTPKTKAVND